MIRNVTIILGGIMLVVGFYSPWGMMTGKGVLADAFDGRHLAELDNTWNLILLSSIVTLAAGVLSLVYTLLGRLIVTLYLGSAALLFSLMPGIFALQLLWNFYRDDLVFTFTENAYAAEIIFVVKIGVILVLVGSLLSALGAMRVIQVAKEFLKEEFT